MSLQQAKALLIYLVQSLASSGNVSKQSTPGAKTVIIEAQAWLRLGDRRCRLPTQGHHAWKVDARRSGHKGWGRGGGADGVVLGTRAEALMRLAVGVDEPWWDGGGMVVFQHKGGGVAEPRPKTGCS